jgi:hypothetical protein
MNFMAGITEEFSNRALWLALFGGAASVRGGALVDEVRDWPLPDNISVRLALAEMFTEHGEPSEVRACSAELLQRTRRGELICLRACDALQSRREVPEFAAMASEFVEQAWRKTQASADIQSKEFLADLVERAVQTRAELVLEGIGAVIQNDESRAAALGRIALDVFLKQLRNSAEVRITGNYPIFKGSR